VPVCVTGAVGALVCSRSAGVCAYLGVAVAGLCLSLCACNALSVPVYGMFCAVWCCECLCGALWVRL